MSWFNYLSRDGSFDDVDATYIYPPIRNQIAISAPYYDIEPNQLLVTKMKDDSFYTKIGTDKTKTTDNKQYVVVYQSDPTSNIFKVVKSNIINSNLYFLSGDTHKQGTKIIEKYYIYYGNSYIKYVEPVTHAGVVKYKQISTANITSFTNTPANLVTADFNLNISTITGYLTTVDAKSDATDGSPVFSYYNQTTDWLEYKSNNPGSKVTGSFKGPRLQLTAQTLKNGGKFKLKIIKKAVTTNDYTDNTSSTIEEKEVVSDVTIDLSSNESLSKVVYEIDTLEYSEEYYFVIEVIEQANIDQKDTVVQFINFKYLEGPVATLESKEYSSVLSFKS